MVNTNVARSNFNKNMNVFGALMSRHLKVFFKNKLTLLFSLMVPLITLAIYMIFLRSLEMNAVKDIFEEYKSNPGYQTLLNASTGLVDAWMYAGLIGVSCITVSLNSCYIIIRDRESGVNRDFVSSPISRKTIVASYFTVNVIITFIINLVMVFVSMIMLWGLGNFHMSFGDFMGIIFVLFMSTIIAALVSILITCFINTEGIFNSIICIASAAVGFLIGAFMPFSMLPTAAAYVCLIFPGTYSVSMFRTFFMDGQVNNVSTVLKTIDPSGAEAKIKELTSQFSWNVNFFGIELNFGWMLLILVIFIIIFAILDGFFSKKSLEIYNKSSKKKHKK